MSSSFALSDAFRKGGSLPVTDDAYKHTLLELTARATRAMHKQGAQLKPEVAAFKEYIESDSILQRHFNEVISLIPIPDVGNYDVLFWVLDTAISTSPSFERDGYGTLGPPAYMMLAQTMSAEKSFDSYRAELDKHFNAMIKSWVNYLTSEASCEVLNDKSGGWFSPEAMDLYESTYGLSFFDMFESENNPETHYGFTSFDDFFTRCLKPGICTVEHPNDFCIISAPCEGTLYNISRDVQKDSELWIKGRQYSFADALHGVYVDEFVGGTVYQAFLSSGSYHHWHSPVEGTIVKTEVIKGDYFAELPNQPSHPVFGMDLEQTPFMRYSANITFAPSRQLIYINADSPDIGLMCFIAIGMTEVSSCGLGPSIRVGQHVKRGNELGMFHFGGSSYALVFKPDVKLQLSDGYSNPGDHVKVNHSIATVTLAEWYA